MTYSYSNLLFSVILFYRRHFFLSRTFSFSQRRIFLSDKQTGKQLGNRSTFSKIHLQENETIERAERNRQSLRFFSERFHFRRVSTPSPHSLCFARGTFSLFDEEETGQTNRANNNRSSSSSFREETFGIGRKQRNAEITSRREDSQLSKLLLKQPRCSACDRPRRNFVASIVSLPVLLAHETFVHAVFSGYRRNSRAFLFNWFVSRWFLKIGYANWPRLKVAPRRKFPLTFLFFPPSL